MKILGFKVNKDNNLKAHLDFLSGKLTMTYNCIKEALPFLTPENRKVVVNSKMRGQINIVLPLILNQTNAVKKKAETMLMRINKIIYGKKYFKVNNEKICKEIGMQDPEVEIVKASAKAIHKLMYNQKTPSLKKLITRTNRSTSNYYHLTPKKKTYRTTLEVLIQLYK